MANLAPVARQRFFDDNGYPLAGGLLHTYAAGTTTPLATYTDQDAGDENENPIELDSEGYADIYIGTSSYKFRLTDSLGNEIWTKDNIRLPVVDSGFSTGDVKISIKTVADSGWVLMNDTTIGSSGSGATGRANNDTEALYTLLWNNTVNANCAVSSGRGASAAADFAANKTIALPKALGRALAVYGSGSGLTPRALAVITGDETVALSEANLASHTHTFTGSSHKHTISVNTGSGEAVGTAVASTSAAIANSSQIENEGIWHRTSSAENNAVMGAVVAGGTNSNTGSGTAHANMQPTLFLNIMIKL